MGSNATVIAPAARARLEVVIGILIIAFALVSGGVGSTVALWLGLGLFMRGRVTDAAPPTSRDLRWARHLGWVVAALACARFLWQYASRVDLARTGGIVAVRTAGLLLLATLFALMAGVLAYRIGLAYRGLGAVRVRS